MKRGSTLILRAVVLLMGLALLAVSFIGLPLILRSELKGDFDYTPLFIGLYVPILFFMFALYQAHLLLNCIDKDKAFSAASVIALKNIKRCSFAISGIFAAGMPYIFYLADRDDAPGVAALGFVLIGAPFVVGTATAVFQRLFQNAVDIKSENDLTV